MMFPMSKPIESTPILKGQDLIDFANSITKEPTKESIAHLRSAQALLELATNR